MATLTIYPSENTYTRSSVPGSTAPVIQGENPLLQTRIGGWGDTYWSYFKFDLSSIPVGSIINTATLNLPVLSIYGGDPVGNVYRSAGAFAEATTTWTNQPGSTGSSYGSFSNGSAGTTSTFNILTLLNEWIAGTYVNDGICIKNSFQNPHFRNFGSKSQASPSDRTRLEIDYTPPTIEQEGFRWRDDDGDEDGATWLQSQDAHITRAKETITRLRVLLNATNDPGAKQFQLEYRVKDSGDPWTKIT